MIESASAARIAAQPPVKVQTTARDNLLQRKCACGGSGGAQGTCEECKKEGIGVQRYSAGRPGPATIIPWPMGDDGTSGPGFELGRKSNRVPGHDFSHISVRSASGSMLQRKEEVGGSTDAEEQGRNDEAGTRADTREDIASQTAAGPSSRVAYPLVQRAPMPGSSPTPAATPATPTPAAGERPAAQQTGTRALIVDDDAEQIGPGQMRKGQFLDQLQSSVCNAADAELARVGRNTQGCPYIEGWIGHYRRTSAAYLERALRRYAPEAASARTATDYIPAVTERVRRGVALWATTGQISGIPDELKGQLPGAGALAAAGAVAGAVSGLVGGIGRALGGIFTKAREGGAKDAGDPQEIKGQLGAGQSLDGGVRSKMESAFGHSFSNVRVHTDARAADLSSNLNARAFTIGSDVAFSAGEYRPGTLIGDALLAHELAHVVQQGGSAESASAPQMQGGEYGALEEDADRSAVSAVASIWGGRAGIGQDALDSGNPRLRSGLRLSRCKGPLNTRQNDCTTRATAATPVKTVTVRNSQLWGGKGAAGFATDLANANTVWAMAGIAFAAGNAESIDEPHTKDPALLGPNALLNDSGTPPRRASYTAEEVALMSHNKAAGQVTTYYIKDVENTAGLNGRTFEDDDAIVVVATAPTRSLAHEFGHIFGGAGHPPNNDNIMAQSGVATGVDCLSDDQIDAARSSSVAR